MNALGSLIVAMTMVGSSAFAEPVSIRSGSAQGQGWVTQVGERCVVVTAAHVLVQDRAEVVSAGDVRGSAAAIYRHPTLDIAVIEVEGRLKAICPSSGLGFADSRPVLNAARGGLQPIAVEMAGVTGNASVTPVQIDSIDATEPYFTIRGLDTELQFGVRGDSGSAIREYGDRGGVERQPLGIVVEALGPRVARAIRFDEARRFVEMTFSAPSTGIRRAAVGIDAELLGFDGDLASDDCGPVDVVRDASCVMRARAQRGSRIRLEVGVSSNESINGVRITFGEAESETVIIEGSIEGASFVRLRSCTSGIGGVADCSLAPRRLKALRFTFDEDIRIRRAEILQEER